MISSFIAALFILSQVPVAPMTGTGAQPAAPGAPALQPGVKPTPQGPLPEVHLGLLEANKEIFIAQHFHLVLTVMAGEGVIITLPSKINGGPRFQIEGEPRRVSTEKLDSGKIKTTWHIKLASFMTDRLIDRKLERVNTRLKRREGDLNEAKTALTEAKLAGHDTASLKERIATIEGRIAKDKNELKSLQRKYELHPIPVSFKRPDGTLGVVMSHEWGGGPKIIISSKLANEPNPELKEPASEENKKAGGPFWKPYSLYEENTTLKNVLWGILIGLIIFALLTPLVIFIIRKRKKEAPLPPPQPAHEIAFSRLDELKERGSPDEEQTQEYAFELSEILREYCGNRYHFYSLEMTTTELFEKLRTLPPIELDIPSLEEYFDTLDLIKFAKMPMTPAEFPEHLEHAYEVVRTTMLTGPEELIDEDEAAPPVAQEFAGHHGSGRTLDESLTDGDDRYLPLGEPDEAPPAVEAQQLTPPPPAPPHEAPAPGDPPAVAQEKLPQSPPEVVKERLVEVAPSPPEQPSDTAPVEDEWAPKGLMDPPPADTTQDPAQRTDALEESKEAPSDDAWAPREVTDDVPAKETVAEGPPLPPSPDDDSKWDGSGEESTEAESTPTHKDTV